jgi:hypothetical protein
LKRVTLGDNFALVLFLPEVQMRRIISSAMAGLLLVGPQLAAQQDEEPGQVYVAYHKVSFADMQEWIGIYYEHTVPVLEALQEEGVIQGWNVWQHSTGGEYNWRFGIRATDWSQYSRFWSEFLSRLQEGSPEAFSRSLAMIQAHHDEIWDIDEVHVPDPAPAFQYIYDSQFQISFADIEEWNRAWNETVRRVGPHRRSIRAFGLAAHGRCGTVAETRQDDRGPRRYHLDLCTRARHVGGGPYRAPSSGARRLPQSPRGTTRLQGPCVIFGWLRPSRALLHLL